MKDIIKIKCALGICFGLSVVPLGFHLIERTGEANKVAGISQEIKWAEKSQQKIKNFCSDGFITLDESREIYKICSHPIDTRVLHDSSYLTTKKGADIEYRLWDLRFVNPFYIPITKEGFSNREKIVNVVEDYKKYIGSGEYKIVNALEDYKKYIGSAEYKQLIRPLNAKERIARVLTAVILD